MHHEGSSVQGCGSHGVEGMTALEHVMVPPSS
jgi:hypothetical protein